ncbi:MAG: transposase [Thiotrichaceae bacterium]|uniref:Transposase n=1 Tax=Candidatus Thiocaldithrix dubininis TaxID=3080823 RepID=A0AA95H680_9GAMM|nr:MAG: transposase [Candidatus Thiocaldithrix dubininis]
MFWSITTPAFKEKAVALVTEQSYSGAEAAEFLDIRANQLYEWKQ